MYRLVVDLFEPFTLLFLLTALAVANLWRKRLETRRRLLLVVVPLLALAMLCTPALAYLALGSLEWRYPPRHNERPHEAEAVVVLSGGIWLPDDVRVRTELAEDTLYRCLHAARLYRQGGPCLVVLSGGKVDPRRPGLTLASAMHDFLLEQGIPESDMLIEDQSRTTYENAVQTAELLGKRGIEKIVLVTEATHLLRGELCFRAQGLEVTPSGCRYRATSLNWSPSKLLPDAGAARDVQRAAHEWVGLAWYRLHGRI